MFGRILKQGTAIAIAVAGLYTFSAPAGATSVAIIEGSFYTSNLKTQLEANGVTVSELTSYTAASLAGFDAVIHYGNSFLDQTALASYVSGGGRLIETPWFWLNFAPIDAALQIFTDGGGTDYSTTYPGVTVLDASSDLLAGVTFPAGPGPFSIGRTSGNGFVGGVDQVANWADGTAMIGEKALGAGLVVGINMHVITSDTAFSVIDQPWATRLFLNAINADVAVAAVPEPATLILFGLGLAGLGMVRRRKA